jgi:shikimate kinase
MKNNGSSHPIHFPWKVTLVGPCAAGKSTLVARLRAEGVAARCVSQEHSHVPYLWQMSNPDVLIYLDLGLPTVQRRLRRPWSQTLFDEQQRRLAHARAHAHLVLPTDDRTPDDLAAQVLQYLQTFDPTAQPLPPDPALLRAFRGGHLDPGAT